AQDEPPTGNLDAPLIGGVDALDFEADSVGLGRQESGGLGDARRLRAAAQPSCARLLPGAIVAVERPSLDSLVDRLDQHAVLRLGDVVLPLGDGSLEPAEVGLDRGGVAAVLEPLTLRAQDPLLL